MTFVCPTVLANNAHTFRTQMERIEPFAQRIQIDLVDGIFADSKTISPHEVWWPDNVFCDIHLMYKEPIKVLPTIIKLHPAMLIVHAEADGNFITIAERLREAGIRVGIALLPGTKVSTIAPIVDLINHVLIFGGDLGHFGGKADLSLAEKAIEINNLSPMIEVGWDGGVNDKNIATLVKAGVDVINVGGYIQTAKNPEKAYAKLKEIAERA